MTETIIFYALASAVIGSALVVVLARNVFTSALYLAVALGSVAGIFAMLGADFLAAVQLLLYVGGVMILIAFVVMISSIARSLLEKQMNDQWGISAATSLIVFALVALSILKFNFVMGPEVNLPTTHGLGLLLLNEMALPFEAVSLIVLVALVGAILFARHARKKSLLAEEDSQIGEKK